MRSEQSRGEEAGSAPAVSIKKSKKLEAMRANPRDWSMNDVSTVCRQVGLTMLPPSRGSHHKVLSPMVGGILVIPTNKPIKPPYIKLLVAMADAHISLEAQDVLASSGDKANV